MALEFLHRAAGKPARVALFPGTWNPPTIAHVDIARMARCQVDEVIWLLPRVFPHKGFEGAGFDARRRMLETLARQDAGFSAAVSHGGLYAEMAAEARDYFGPHTEIVLVLGRDAVERIAAWIMARLACLTISSAGTGSWSPRGTASMNPLGSTGR